jgi:serine/threonine-protein kinase
MKIATPNDIHGYKVIRSIGHGAGSDLFVVHDPMTHELFALKRVVVRDQSSRRFLKQVEREHEVASMVTHPAIRRSHRIMRVREVIRTSEISLLLRFVDGDPLDCRSSSDLPWLLEVFAGASDGLAHLHGLGWAHADIKPGNILLGSEGNPVLIDLGQACPLGSCKDRIQGTPGFMAREQASLGPIDARTDIFCLGASLYWMLAGRYGSCIMQDAGANADSAPLHLENPQVSVELGRLVDASISANPSRRPGRADQFAAELRGIAGRLRDQGVDSPVLQPA